MDEGFSAKQIRRRRDRGEVNDDAARPVHPKYVPPPPLPKDLRQCIQCGGTYDRLQTERDSWAPQNTAVYCDRECELDHHSGVDGASSQQRVRMSYEGDISVEQIRTGSYLNYAH
jgi:hypothetical protein